MSSADFFIEILEIYEAEQVQRSCGIETLVHKLNTI